MKREDIGIAKRFHIRYGALAAICHEDKHFQNLWNHFRTTLGLIEDAILILGNIDDNFYISEEVPGSREEWSEELELQKRIAKAFLQQINLAVRDRYGFPLVDLSEHEWGDDALVGEIEEYLCQCVDEEIADALPDSTEDWNYSM